MSFRLLYAPMWSGATYAKPKVRLGYGHFGWVGVILKPVHCGFPTNGNGVPKDAAVMEPVWNRVVAKRLPLLQTLCNSKMRGISTWALFQTLNRASLLSSLINTGVIPAPLLND